MVDLGGYVIILVETSDKRVKLYGESTIDTFLVVKCFIKWELLNYNNTRV